MRKLPFHYGWLIVVAGILSLFSCLGLARFAFGMLVPGMREGLALGYDQIGYLGTGNFVGYLLSVALTPVILNWLRPRFTMVSGLALIALTLAGMAQARSFSVLLGLYALTGIGSGLANISTMVLIAHWFRREKRGKAAGLMVLGNGFAIIFSGFVVPLFNRLHGVDGWRVSWFVLAVISVGIAVFVAVAVRNEPAELELAPVGEKRPVSAAEMHGERIAAPGRALVSLGLLYLAFGMTYMVYGTFVVTSMVEEYGFSEVAAGHFWSWVGFFGLFSGVLFGALSDRIGRKYGLAAVYAIQTLAYLLVGAGWGGSALWLSVFFYGIAAFAVPAIMTAAVSDYLGVARAAAGFSLITFFFAAGQTVGPAVAGLIAEKYAGFSPAFLLSAGVTFAALLFALTLPRPGNGE